MKLGMIYLVICLVTFVLNFILTWRLLNRGAWRRSKAVEACEDVITFKLDSSSGIEDDTVTLQ